MIALRNTIAAHLPLGFEEGLSGKMISWNVPLETYPAGYHCTPGAPLPFLAVASQKAFIAVYHMGLYARPELMAWFTDAWAKHTPTKLDMGKSCIRLKKLDAMPLDPIGELVGKMTPQDWIAIYEAQYKR